MPAESGPPAEQPAAAEPAAEAAPTAGSAAPVRANTCHRLSPPFPCVFHRAFTALPQCDPLDRSRSRSGLWASRFRRLRHASRGAPSAVIGAAGGVHTASSANPLGLLLCMFHCRSAVFLVCVSSALVEWEEATRRPQGGAAGGATAPRDSGDGRDAGAGLIQQ